MGLEMSSLPDEDAIVRALAGRASKFPRNVGALASEQLVKKKLSEERNIIALKTSLWSVKVKGRRELIAIAPVEHAAEAEEILTSSGIQGVLFVSYQIVSKDSDVIIEFYYRNREYKTVSKFVRAPITTESDWLDIEKYKNVELHIIKDYLVQDIFIQHLRGLYKGELYPTNFDILLLENQKVYVIEVKQVHFKKWKVELSTTQAEALLDLTRFNITPLLIVQSKFSAPKHREETAPFLKNPHLLVSSEMLEYFNWWSASFKEELLVPSDEIGKISVDISKLHKVGAFKYVCLNNAKLEPRSSNSKSSKDFSIEEPLYNNKESSQTYRWFEDEVDEPVEGEGKNEGLRLLLEEFYRRANY